MLSRNMVHCDNELQIKEERVVCKEGMFSSISVSTGYQHAIKISYFMRYFVLLNLLPDVHTSKNKSYCVNELCSERLNIRSFLKPFVTAL